MNETLKNEIESELAILRKQLEEDGKTKNKSIENIVNEITPTTGEVKVEDVKLPINTNPKVLHAKFPYKEYGHLTLISNFDGQDNKHNKERYIYDDNIKIQDLAAILGGTRQTVSKNIKKLEASGIMVKDPINPKVYKIKYTFEGKGDYITIHRDILKKLVEVYKSDVIAVYCWLCIKLRNGKSVLYRESICEGVGLNITKRNLDKISSITNSLENEGLIGKEVEHLTRRDERRKQTTYILATAEEYKLGIYRIRKAMRDKISLDEKGIEI